MRPSRTRSRDRQGSGKQARKNGKLQSGSDALQRTLCQDDCADSTDAAACSGSEGSIDMSVDLTPFPDANAPWEAGGFVIAPRPGESQRGLMRLIAKTPEGEWRAELVQPYTRCRATVKEASKHKQGPGFFVKAPRELPLDMPATRWFFEKTYGNLSLSEAEAEVQKQNEAIARWCATKNSVLLSDRADSVSDSIIYSLSEARLLGESSLASLITLLSRVYGSDARREAA